jgi:hypothetical protein
VGGSEPSLAADRSPDVTISRLKRADFGRRRQIGSLTEG